MMPSPAKRHDLAAFRIARQLNRQIPAPLIASNIGDAESETLGSLRRPDVLVLPESSLDSEGDRVNPRNGTCVHLWDPVGEEYANRLHDKFGDKIPIGDWTIDTSELPLYSPEEQ